MKQLKTKLLILILSGGIITLNLVNVLNNISTKQSNIVNILTLIFWFMLTYLYFHSTYLEIEKLQEDNKSN